MGQSILHIKACSAETDNTHAPRTDDAPAVQLLNGTLVGCQGSLRFLGRFQRIVENVIDLQNNNMSCRQRLCRERGGVIVADRERGWIKAVCLNDERIALPRVVIWWQVQRPPHGMTTGILPLDGFNRA